MTTLAIDIGGTKIAAAVCDENDSIIQRWRVPTPMDAAAINLGLYTDDSANALRAALKKAREVSDNSNATQKQVDAAREALEKAIAALVKRTAAKGDGNVVSNTGANVVTIAVAGLLLAGAGAAIAYRRNREQM